MFSLREPGRRRLRPARGAEGSSPRNGGRSWAKPRVPADRKAWSFSTGPLWARSPRLRAHPSRPARVDRSSVGGLEVGDIFGCMAAPLQADDVQADDATALAIDEHVRGMSWTTRAWPPTIASRPMRQYDARAHAETNARSSIVAWPPTRAALAKMQLLPTTTSWPEVSRGHYVPLGHRHESPRRASAMNRARLGTRSGRRSPRVPTCSGRAACCGAPPITACSQNLVVAARSSRPP